MKGIIPWALRLFCARSGEEGEERQEAEER